MRNHDDERVHEINIYDIKITETYHAHQRWCSQEAKMHVDYMRNLYRSIRNSGLLVPITVLADNQLLDGLHRLYVYHMLRRTKIHAYVAH